MNAHSKDFTDYYFVLQVHQNAEPEIIKSAYRRLAQMYHPDLNRDPQAVAKMQLINQAYNVISNPVQRRAYHTQWLRHHQMQEGEGKPSAQRPEAAAQQALDAYFRCLLQEDWVSAYQRLTLKDRSMVPLGDFCEWKEAVKALYQMGSYVIKPFRTYGRCIIGQTEYEKAHVFSVFLTDRDNRTGNVSEETYTKYVVLDKGVWRVCLGYSELKTIIYKLKYLATQAPDMDPARIYRDTLLKLDKLTGFLSRKGLLEQAEKEISRARRFKSSFCIAVLSIEPAGSLSGISGSDYMHMCVSNAAAQLKNTLRSIDYAARFSENQLAVLLIQTDYNNARKALTRLLRSVKPGEGLKYAVNGSITAYSGETAEDTLLRAAHEARKQVMVGEDKIRKYRFKLEDQQV